MENSQNRVLRKSSEFISINRTGKRVKLAPWLSVSYKKNSLGYLRYGYTISRKVGKANIRNRIKRWCREIVRKKITEGFDGSMDIHLFFIEQKSDFYKKLSYVEVKEPIGNFIESSV